MRASSPLLLRFLFLSFLASSSKSMSAPATARKVSVGVIGGGAAGLAAARAFGKIFPAAEVDVFEKGAAVGGVWNYKHLDKHLSKKEKSSKSQPMYRHLKTNLPKELMAYREFPFQEEEASYVSHESVQRYLSSYASHFALLERIKFCAEVVALEFAPEAGAGESNSGRKVVVRWRQHRQGGAGGALERQRTYDHVVVANGHYALASVPRQLCDLRDNFAGDVVHAIEYDAAGDEFAGKTILCVGGRASGTDIARELSRVARRVYVSDSKIENLAREGEGNVFPCPRTTGLLDSDPGKILLDDGTVLDDVDIVVLCTGYDYEFPFMGDNVGLSNEVGERRVGPLYKQLFHARHPTLSFIGLPHSVVPFPLFEFQAEAVASAAKCDFRSLPPAREREISAAADFNAGGPSGTRVLDTHYLSDFQWDYCREMCAMSGTLVDDKVRKFIETNEEIYNHSSASRKGSPLGGNDAYREVKYARDTVNFSSWSVVKSPSASRTTA